MGDMWLIIAMLVCVVLFIEGCHWYVRGYLGRAYLICAPACIGFGMCIGRIVF